MHLAAPLQLVLSSRLNGSPSGRSTNNSATAILDSLVTSSVRSSSVASSVVSLALVTMSLSFVLTAQDLSQAFSRALRDSLPQSQLTALNVTASGSVPSHTCSSSFPINSSQGFAAGLSAGNIVVPLLVSTYCTLGNSSLSHPSLFGSHGAPRVERFPQPASSSLQHFPHPLPGSLSHFFAVQAFCHWPRIFTHSREAGYKNKERAIRRSSGPATQKRQGPGLRAAVSGLANWSCMDSDL